MRAHLVAVLVSILAYVALDLSKIYQRRGLAMREHAPVAGWLLWTVATLTTLGSALAIIYALTLGSVSLVGALAGTGLVAVALFARLVLHQSIGQLRWLGVLVITASAAAIGLVSNVRSGDALLSRLFIMFGVQTVAFIVAWVVTHGHHDATGPVIAAFAGSLGGFVALFQKAATTEAAANVSLLSAVRALEFRLLGPDPSPLLGDALNIIANPFSASWILLSWASMLVLQFAYRWGTVVFIMPAFTATLLLTPVLGGALVFGERLPPLAWAGVALMLVGVGLSSAEGRPAEPEQRQRSRRLVA